MASIFFMHALACDLGGGLANPRPIKHAACQGSANRKNPGNCALVRIYRAAKAKGKPGKCPCREQLH
jgi:hypothetical protein